MNNHGKGIKSNRHKLDKGIQSNRDKLGNGIRSHRNKHGEATKSNRNKQDTAIKSIGILGVGAPDPIGKGINPIGVSRARASNPIEIRRAAA